MRLLLVLALPLAALAQPTIDPAAVTLAPGGIQQFTSNAKTPFWNIGGNGAIDARSGKYTAPAALMAVGATVRVTDLSTGKHADAIVTLAAPTVGSASCACKDGAPGIQGSPGRDGKDGAAAGDIFVVSSNPPTIATLSKAEDGTWTATTQITDSFLALVAIYRNGVRVAKENVVSVTLTNGKLILTTNGIAWPSGDVVTADFVSVTNRP